MRSDANLTTPAGGTSIRKPRRRLKAAHRRTACRLEVIFGEGFEASCRFAHKLRTDVRRNVTRLANLVGAVSAVSVAETYTRAMFELYARVARGEDVRKALRAAGCIHRAADPRWLTPPPGAPAARLPLEDAAATSRRDLLESIRQRGAQDDEAYIKRHPLGSALVTHELFAAHNVHNGDVWRFTLDGDAEHGELAMVTFYDEGHGRSLCAAFLFVEGEHFCLRRSPPLECRDVHREPEFLTVIGRVVRVERDGLPARLKGLELRGLPFADDEAPGEEAQRRAA